LWTNLELDYIVAVRVKIWHFVGVFRFGWPTKIVSLELAWRLRMLSRSQTQIWGNAMRKAVLAAAVCAAASLQPASAAERSCYSPTDLEAEQAIVFQTNLMVVSSACRDLVYGEFRARNSQAIIRYQKIMIDHFRREGFRNAQSRFDSWNTSLANEIALKQGVTPTAVVCQQAADMLKMASSLDSKGLHDYAVAQASSPAETHPRCGK
jgi:hypothetical protein